eukprot:10146195-Heterocapsa_arctica.AAC.1
MAATCVKRAPLTTREGAAQKVRRRVGVKRPATSAPDEGFVGLVSITGPPWYDEVMDKELDPKLVATGMKNEENSLDNFGTYIWVPAKLAEQKC